MLGPINSYRLMTWLMELALYLAYDSILELSWFKSCIVLEVRVGTSAVIGPAGADGMMGVMGEYEVLCAEVDHFQGSGVIDTVLKMYGKFRMCHKSSSSRWINSKGWAHGYFTSNAIHGRVTAAIAQRAPK